MTSLMAITAESTFFEMGFSKDLKAMNLDTAHANIRIIKAVVVMYSCLPHLRSSHMVFLNLVPVPSMYLAYSDQLLRSSREEQAAGGGEGEEQV